MIIPVVYDSKSRQKILDRSGVNGSSVEQSVRQIISEVRARGDAALYDYTERFDGAKLDALAVSDGEFERAEKMVGDEYKAM